MQNVIEVYLQMWFLLKLKWEKILPSHKEQIRTLCGLHVFPGYIQCLNTKMAQSRCGEGAHYIQKKNYARNNELNAQQPVFQKTEKLDLTLS